MNARAVVVRVIDGDTIWIRLRVRLRQSAPDTGQAAVDATNALERRFPQGKRVQVVIGAVDEYGRIVGDLVPDHTTEPRTRKRAN